MRPDPYACTWLIESEDRSPRMVLEANRNHWNPDRVPRVERVVFRNELTQAQALDLCLAGDGEVDIVTELSPVDAPRVVASPYADLQVFDANRVLVGIINRWPSDTPLGDVRVRRALNMAIDRQVMVDQGLGGYAHIIPALTPPWCSGFPSGAKPYAHDPQQAKGLLDAAGWPKGRPVRIGAPAAFEGLAQMAASQIGEALGVGTEVMVVDGAEMRAMIEKKLAPRWDILLHGWFDLSSEAPPAAVHREFFGSDGAFRAGPEDPEFDRLFRHMVAQLEGEAFVTAAEELDRYAFDQALALFICAPQALYAVNKYVSFLGYRTTFELAETEVADGHWSRQQTGQTGQGGQNGQMWTDPRTEPGVPPAAANTQGFHGAGC